jgi:hypothetical protein
VNQGLEIMRIVSKEGRPVVKKNFVNAPKPYEAALKVLFDFVLPDFVVQVQAENILVDDSPIIVILGSLTGC